MSVFDELNNTEKIRPTTEWMQKWYDIMNNELFGGALGDCILRPFTTGRGSNGRTLGWFKITGNNIKIKRANRQIFQQGYYGGQNYITRENFVSICKPAIELNANYRAAETSWINTLVHEMCHYYTYMYGIAPKQGHGPEFRQIGEVVSSRSHGYISIQRLASAEEMQGFDLNDEIKQKNQERSDRKKSKTTALIVVTDNGGVRLLMTTSEKVISEVGDVHAGKNDVLFFGSCNDFSLIDFLVSKGFRQTMRTYRYWSIENDTWLNELSKYNWQKYMGSCNTLSEALGVEEKTDQATDQLMVQPQSSTQQDSNQQENNDYNLGWKIIEDNNGYNLINKEGKKAFPQPVNRIKFDKNKNCYYVQFGRITNNFRGRPGMWEKTDIWEHKQKTAQSLFEDKLRKMIKETLLKMVNEKLLFDDDAVSITPDMNLGIESPLEDRDF